jgi:tRNA(Ile)-lysidine synthetase-like protein
MHERLLATIRRLNLIPPGSRVVVAVSGGADSLALLHALAALRRPLDLWLAVATLDHGLRGEAGAADAAFVGEQAQSLGLLCLREQRDVPGYAAQHGLSTEEAAREVRYRFLGESALALRAALVATAHTADDQAETVLMHFLRGSGLDGLKGMVGVGPLPWVERGPEPEATGLAPTHQPTTGAVRLVRPLLWTTRGEIEVYLAELGVTARQDETNTDTAFFRNRLRHELLPLLEDYQPNIRPVLARTAEGLGVDWAWLEAETEAAWGQLAQVRAAAVGFAAAEFRALPEGLQRRLLRRAVAQLRPTQRDLSWEQTTGALALAERGTSGQRATLPGELSLYVGADFLWVLPMGAPPPLPGSGAGTESAWPGLAPHCEPLRLAVPGETALPGGWVVRVEPAAPAALQLIVGAEAQDAPRWQVLLNAAQAGPALALRTRRAGDRFAPLGMGGQVVALADWMTNQKIPAAVRDTLPLLVDANSDTILWVAGYRPAEQVRVGVQTEQCWWVRVIPG